MKTKSLKRLMMLPSVYFYTRRVPLAYLSLIYHQDVNRRSVTHHIPAALPSHNQSRCVMTTIADEHVAGMRTAPTNPNIGLVIPLLRSGQHHR